MHYQLGDFVVAPDTRRIWQAGQPVRLGGRAFDLLVLLLRNRHRVVSKEELYAHIWPGMAVEPNNLSFQVWSLRRLLGHDVVATVARRGYQLSQPVTEHADPVAIRTMAEASSDDPMAVAEADLAAQVRQACAAYPVIDLIAPRAETRRRLARVVGEAWAPHLAGGVWWLPRGVAWSALQRMLQAQSSPQLMLVLQDVHLQPRASLGLVNQLRSQWPQARLVLTSMHTLGHADEHVLTSLPSPEAVVMGDLPQRLRWRPR